MKLGRIKIRAADAKVPEACWLQSLPAGTLFNKNFEGLVSKPVTWLVLPEKLSTGHIVCLNLETLKREEWNSGADVRPLGRLSLIEYIEGDFSGPFS